MWRSRLFVVAVVSSALAAIGVMGFLMMSDETTGAGAGMTETATDGNEAGEGVAEKDEPGLQRQARAPDGPPDPKDEPGLERQARAPDGPPDPTVVRSPAVMGRFYPADPDELDDMVSAYLEEALPAGGEDEIIALIAPHAGYMFSGRVAAEAYRQVAGQRYDTVVVVGPSHHERFRGFALSGADHFETPLGLVEVDRTLRETLLARSAFRVIDKAHEREHSIEVQLPFLQKVAPEAKLLPILMADASLEAASTLGGVLAELSRAGSVLLVASTDMSHYPTYEDAVRVDGEVLEAIETLDPEEVEAVTERLMSQDVPGLGTCLCGEGPVKAILAAARLLGARSARVLRYANSGDVPGASRERVVGYLAAAIHESGPRSGEGVVETHSAD